MITVDTTVAVYALGAVHPLREPCRQAIQAITDGRLRATTSVEVIQEFAHVRARRRGRAEAVDEARDLAALLSPLLRPHADDLELGLTLFESTPHLGAFDAVLAATALSERNVTGLVSADRAFSSVDGLRHLDPGAPDFLEQLGIG